MGNARLGYGTSLEIGGAADTDPYTPVSEVLDISGPGGSADFVEVTSHSSPNNSKEYIRALKDAGELTFDVNFDSTDAGLLAIRTAYQSGDILYWRMTSADIGAEVAVFRAIVTGFNSNRPVQSAMTESITLKITGDIAYS